jgi:hypothetical protein
VKRIPTFAYKDKNGELWTGMCSGNKYAPATSEGDEVIKQYRTAQKKGVGIIFGRISQSKPIWRDDDEAETPSKPAGGLLVQAKSEQFAAIAKTAKDGSYEFDSLPNGKYKVSPRTPRTLDFDHEYEENYEADISDGQCAKISFGLKPRTRIRGHVSFPVGMEARTIEVVALPTDLKKVTQFSGKWDFTDEDGRFDLWPLPPGDYLLGVNINNSPKRDAPFPPTYYPGVTEQKAAHIIHIEEGDVKDLELPLPEVAQPRTVQFVAIGLDGKPMKTIYIQLEDLRHPGDASSYVNVDLDGKGAGTMTVYAGYSYHLHGSHWVSTGNDWCSKAVVVPAGSDLVEARFVMDRKSGNCSIDEIDGLRK